MADGSINGAKVDESSLARVPDAASIGGLPPSAFEGSNRVMFGVSQNANGITTELFSWPEMGLRVRADGDVSSSDLGVTIQNTRASGGGIISILDEVGDGGSPIAPGTSSELPNTDEDFILIDESDSTRAVWLRCLSQDAGGIPSRTFCWGIRSRG